MVGSRTRSSIRATEEGGWEGPLLQLYHYEIRYALLVLLGKSS